MSNVRIRCVNRGYWRLGDTDVTIVRPRPGYPWRVTSTWKQARDWLDEHGLRGATFPTVQSAAQTLRAITDIYGPPPPATIPPARLRPVKAGHYRLGENKDITIQKTKAGWWWVVHRGALIGEVRTLHEASRWISELV